MKENPNLFVFEASTDIAKLFINAKSFLLFVLTISNIAYKDRESSHAW